MCVVCGCSSNEVSIESSDAIHADSKTGDLHFGAGAAGMSLLGMSQERTIHLEQSVLSENNRIAAHNRAHFASHDVLTYNLVSSPGSGKTTLLCATIELMKTQAAHLTVAVIEGDQQTQHDAERIRATGAPAIQVNTGKGCHLDAQMVARAFDALPTHHHHDDAHHHHDEHDHHHTHQPTVLFIENVGNLVCPAMWDLGERAKVAILSVTEGEDKPLKYPDMFAAADVMILNKIDLLPHLHFDVQRCMDYARQVNPNIQIIQLSATTGEGMNEWLSWLQRPLHHTHTHQHSHGDVETQLRARIAQLEAQLSATGHA